MNTMNATKKNGILEGKTPSEHPLRGLGIVWQKLGLFSSSFSPESTGYPPITVL
jgi:hypothetical protein